MLVRSLMCCVAAIYLVTLLRDLHLAGRTWLLALPSLVLGGTCVVHDLAHVVYLRRWPVWFAANWQVMCVPFFCSTLLVFACLRTMRLLPAAPAPCMD